MLTIDQAQGIVLDSVSPLPAERAPLRQALGRTLAEPLVAAISLPPFDNSAMDGYAVVAEDTRGAGPDSPRRLKVVEVLPAGAVSQCEVVRGTAAQIMTGARVPQGADAVVMVEHTRPVPGGLVEILEEAKPDDNLRPAGEDIRAGDVALASGQVLGPGELGLAAALGCTEVKAVRRPRVMIVTTGHELVAPGGELPPGSIYNSNQTALAARVLTAGAELAHCLHVEDDAKAVEHALSSCEGADLILTTGGVSVGEYDFVKTALERLGEIKFWRVLMRPGKPVAFGMALGRPFFALPGNPVSALVTFELLVAPALRKMRGWGNCLPPTVQARLLRDLTHEPPRREYRQAVTRHVDGEYVVDPVEKRGSAMLTSTIGCNSLVVIPETCERLGAGDQVTVIYPAYRE